MISCHALVGINTLQTLKIEGYIKKKKVIVLIDYGSTHNFIHYKLAQSSQLLYISSARVSSNDCIWRNYQKRSW
jgi:hypothetical protein